MKPRLQRLTVVALMYVPLSLLLIQCAALTDAIFPASQDIGLGSQLDREIRANPKEYPLLNDASSKQYVQNMVNTIIQAPEVQYRGKFPYTTEIIRDDKTINAFCTPGGYIYVYTGLIKMLDNEASLAGVLGHEIAHAERRHSANRMVKAYGAQMMLGIVLGNSPDRTAEVAANMFTGLALLKNSRDDESESDDYSFRYLRSTKWYPGAISYFFEKVKGQSSGGTVERFLSTHPLPQDRLEAVAKRVQDAKIPPPTEQNLLSTPYKTFKKRLP
jgi:predicted Zn-dependent protease